MKILRKCWPALLAGALVVAVAGCTITRSQAVDPATDEVVEFIDIQPAPAVDGFVPDEVEDAAEAVVEVVSENQDRVVETVEDAASGNWWGFATKLTALLGAVWAGFVVRKRIRRSRARKAT